MAYDSHNFLLDEPKRTPDNRTRRGVSLAILGALATVLLLVGVDVAVINAAQAPPPRPIITQKVVKLSTSAPIARTVDLSVTPGIKPGPGGKLYDAFSVTSFDVHAGQPVTLVINNTDSTVHSITSPAAGVNIVVRPGTHAYTLLVKQVGRFEWYCNYPCDPYSMMHNGYMRGTITSV